MAGLGMALAGYGAAQPQIQQIDALQAKKNQDAAVAKVLAQYASSQQQGGGGQPPMPGGMPPVGGAPPGIPPSAPGAGGPPMPGGAAPPRPPMAPGPSTQAPPVMPSTQQGGGGFTGGMPDLSTMVTLLSKSNLPPDQQFEALKSYGAFTSPFEKMMNQLEMKQMQMSNQQSMLDQKLQEARDLKIFAEKETDNRQDKNLKAKKDKPQSLSNDPVYQGLKNDVQMWKSQVTNPNILGKAHDDALKKYNAANKKVSDYEKTNNSGAEDTGGDSGAPEGGVPVPAEAKSKPDGTTATDEKGNKWVKQGDYMVPAGE